MITESLMVYGEPKGQPRQRHFAIKIGGKYTARAYTPGTAEAWKSAIACAAKETGIADLNHRGPVHVVMIFEFARPKSHYGSGKNANTVKAGAPRRHLGKPDLDNVAKAAMDALTQVGVWHDDSQVERVFMEKIWAEGASKTLFTITLLQP